MRKMLLGGLFASTFAAGAAFAQSNPTAAELISSLKPTGDVAGTTRGIKPLDSGNIVSALAPSGSVSDTTRGIKPIAPGSSYSAPKPAYAGASHGVASANLTIEFQSGSANLTPAATAELDQLGKALTSSTLAAYNFKIIGHTDTAGDPSTNQTLSEQRAQAVKDYLETKFGVSDARLSAAGVGESDLAVPTPPNTPNFANRRVQVVNLGA
jgi:outer membrane protein OmpA-like peptidoglycan-associated protein